ncbi:MAG: hypothetical protein ACYCVN_02740 [Acidimicrobiales bacterium]
MVRGGGERSFELVGSHEIADRLGLAHPESVHSWRRRYDDFPEPLARLRIGYVWNWADIEVWAQRSGRGSPATREEPE